MAKPNKRPAKPADKSLVELAEDEVRAQLAAIAKQREQFGGFDKDLALGTAALMRALTTAENEKRQAIKGQARALGQFHVEQIVEHLRQRLSAEERADVARDLAGENEEDSLL